MIDIFTVNKAISPEELADVLAGPIANIWRGVREGRIPKIKGMGRLIRFDPRVIRHLYFSRSEISSLKIEQKRRP